MESPSVESLARFRELQNQLADLWPVMTMRQVGEQERILVVVNSINVPVPAHMAPVIPAYEERFLFLVLALLGGVQTRVIYLTSQPILPRLIDYYLSLMRRSLPDDLHRRLELVSVGDGSARPLIDKILERPLLIERLRSMIGDTRHALILPFMTTHKEVELAVRLGVPVYGPDPSSAIYGTKTGARRLFAEAGVPHPTGQEGVHSVSDLVEAVGKLRAVQPGLQAVVVKLDDSAGGLGNSLVKLGGVESDTDLRRRIHGMEVEDAESSADEFLAELERRGGIVEERIVGTEVRSPSVQLRSSPHGQLEIVSTHDQLLGGATGQTFLGCRFPADPAYGALVAQLGERIGRRLAERGVIGRFGVDFVVARVGERWEPYAIEINLRNGGTTHPMLTLQALTDGEFDAITCQFNTSQGQRFYVATDHLESPAYTSLTPDDILDRVEDERLGWNPESLQGVALHLVSAVAVAGRLGLTAIASDPGGAERRLEAAERLVSELARSGGGG